MGAKENRLDRNSLWIPDVNEAAGALEEYEGARKAINRVIDLGIRFPSWPFVTQRAHVAFFEFGWALDPAFIDFLAHMARRVGDDKITMFSAVPDAFSYCEMYGRSPAITVGLSPSTGDAMNDYLDEDPNNDARGNLALSSSFIIYTSASGDWAAWADRYSEFGMVCSSRAVVDEERKFNLRFDAAEVVDFFTPPQMWPRGFTDELELFVANMSDHSM